jgi:hypothetical protein
MRTAGARALREDDNQMTEREAVLSAWEQKSLSLIDESPLRTRRFQRREEERPAPDNVVELGERRTVTITGQANTARPRRRSAAQQQLATQPDRVALWAVLLGLFLVVVAAGTANAAPL